MLRQGPAPWRECNATGAGNGDDVEEVDDVDDGDDDGDGDGCCYYDVGNGEVYYIYMFL